MVFEQPDNLETLQTDLAKEIKLSDECVESGKGSYGEDGMCYATVGILHELRIARLERMIKAEKERLAPEAADTKAKLDAVLAAVTPSSDSYEFEEGEDGC